MCTTPPPPPRPSRRPYRPTRRGLPPSLCRSAVPEAPRGPLTEELGDELRAAAQGDALVLPAELQLRRHGRCFPAARFESDPAPARPRPFRARGRAEGDARRLRQPSPAFPLGIAIPCGFLLSVENGLRDAGSRDCLVGKESCWVFLGFSPPPPC